MKVKIYVLNRSDSIDYEKVGYPCADVRNNRYALSHMLKRVEMAKENNDDLNFVVTPSFMKNQSKALGYVNNIAEVIDLTISDGLKMKFKLEYAEHATATGSDNSNVIPKVYEFESDNLEKAKRHISRFVSKKFDGDFKLGYKAFWRKLDIDGKEVYSSSAGRMWRALRLKLEVI